MTMSMLDPSVTAPSVEIHHGPGYAFVYPVPAPDEAAATAAAAGADPDELIAAVRDAQILWRHLQGRAQYGYCDQHHDRQGHPILVFRTTDTVRCVTCHRPDRTRIVCPACGT